jgi:hypothetical protein
MTVTSKTMIGMTSQTAVAGGNFIVAINLESGDEEWHF